MFTLEKSRLRGDLINEYEYLKGGCKEDGARLFSGVPSDRTRGSEHRLKYKRFPLTIRKYILTVGVLEHRNGKIVKSPSLEILKSYLNTVLGNCL